MIGICDRLKGLVQDSATSENATGIPLKDYSSASSDPLGAKILSEGTDPIVELAFVLSRTVVKLMHLPVPFFFTD